MLSDTHNYSAPADAKKLSSAASLLFANMQEDKKTLIDWQFGWCSDSGIASYKPENRIQACVGLTNYI